MDIDISKATEKEFGDFGEKAWRGEDIEHFGEPVTYMFKDFMFKATQNGEIVGKIFGQFEAGVGFIDSLIIAKNKRRQGIGRMLVAEVEKFGKQLGAHKIFLFTMENWEASRFYENLGYKNTGVLPKHYLQHDFVIYSKYI